MGEWLREARVGAARQFGARHYRKFAALELVGAVLRQLFRFAVPLLAVGAISALAWFGWRREAASSLPWR